MACTDFVLHMAAQTYHITKDVDVDVDQRMQKMSEIAVLISALTFTNRYAGINKPCWQTVEL